MGVLYHWVFRYWAFCKIQGCIKFHFPSKTQEEGKEKKKEKKRGKKKGGKRERGKGRGKWKGKEKSKGKGEGYLRKKGNSGEGGKVWRGKRGT